MQPVLRFAPSPNGALHLGHAYSAILNFELAKRLNGRFLIRIEDIDQIRCTQERKDQILDDLAWLGLEWQDPVLYQSSRFDAYQAALRSLKDQALLYPSTASRGDIKQAVAKANSQTSLPWPQDPDHAPLYPRKWLEDKEEIDQINQPNSIAWRLDMKAALNTDKTWQQLHWREFGNHPNGIPIANHDMSMKPERWGDVILARKDCQTSYHLSVVLDDALQGITHIVRGQDLFWATGLHRLLQEIFKLPQPIYFHHDLLTNEEGEKLSKSRYDTSLKSLREQGYSPQDIRKMIGLSADSLKRLDKSLGS